MHKRRYFRFLFPALAAVFLLSLCFRVTEPGFIPKETVKNYAVFFKFLFAKLTDSPLYHEYRSTANSIPYYYETLVRFKNSLITLLSGMAVCLAGSAYQTAFHNPIASPNMMGVTSGVHLGSIIFFLVYGAEAMTILNMRYIYCYACSAVLIALIIVCGRAAGKTSRQHSVMDMIIVGSILSQFCNVLVMYLQFKLEEMDTDLLLSYQQLSLGTYVATDTISLVVCFGSIFVSAVPVMLLCYRYNLTSFSDDEVRVMGANPLLLRGIGLVCGGILSLTAIVICGDMGVLAMALPFICRGIFGSDFRNLSISSMCLGGIVMLLGRALCSMIRIGGLVVPANFILTIIVLPVFAITMSKRGSNLKGGF